MLHGTLVAESLRPGTKLEDLRLIVRQIVRHEPDGTTDEQPSVWTDIYYEVDERDAEGLPEKLADALGSPAWYTDLRSETETIVVYRGKIFRYRRGDPEGRAQAVAHGRAHGVPADQLDWPV